MNQTLEPQEQVILSTISERCEDIVAFYRRSATSTAQLAMFTFDDASFIVATLPMS